MPAIQLPLRRWTAEPANELVTLAASVPTEFVDEKLG